MNAQNQGDLSLLTMITQVVERHGCKLVDVDFENMVINVEGSEEDKVACALALQDVLDRTPAGGGAER